MHFGARGYFVSTVGADETSVRDYGCAAGQHPGPLGAQLDHNDAALLQGLQCEGAAGLPPGHGAHRQPLPGARNVLTEAK
jgi:hypothetical protein